MIRSLRQLGRLLTYGKVTDIKGNPLRNSLVEIWQVDNNGCICTREVALERNLIRISRDTADF